MVTYDNLLGLTISSDLKWNTHVFEVVRSSSAQKQIPLSFNVSPSPKRDLLILCFVQGWGCSSVQGARVSVNIDSSQFKGVFALEMSGFLVFLSVLVFVFFLF